MTEIQVISKDTIPPINEVTQGGQVHSLGELRDFRWSDQLKEFMPPASKFSVSWVHLKHGEVLEPHVHPIHSMMVLYAGAGEMLGAIRRRVQADDVVVVPAGCEHGFVGGPDGLSALSIQFGDGFYTEPEKPRVEFLQGEDNLSGLLAYNEKRLKDFSERQIFDLLEDGTLEDPKKRQAYLGHLQPWVDGNQTLLLSRQANCRDEKYYPVFLKHLAEETGHDELHKERPAGEEPITDDNGPRDAVMEAITNWFAWQMYVLDNAEKAAIVHLVIESASNYYHQRAMPVIGKFTNSEYLRIHTEEDVHHIAMGLELLHDETPAGYGRLKRIVGEAWDMVGAMTDRLVELTRAA